ncbi:MAG: META domain-containing protein [Hyphomicrobiales bacterium]
MRRMTIPATACVAAFLAAPAIAAPQPVLLSCGGERLAVTFGERSATVVFGGDTIEMPQATSADGARYEKAGDPSTWFWNKGDLGTLSIRGKTLPACAPAAQVYTASGNEPGWRLDVWQDGWFSFRPQEGARVLVTPGPKADVDGDVTRYTIDLGGKPLAVEARRGVCMDTMTGMPHPDSVTVSIDGRTLNGCGGAPSSLLTGAEWAVTSIGDKAADPGQKVTIGFGGDGQMAGKGPCNRYMGPWAISGEGLSIGPAAATMMACPGTAMDDERAFFDILNAVNRFEIAADGALVLHAADGKTIRARR